MGANPIMECAQNLYDSAKIAANFVLNAMKNTEGDSSHWYGVKFEPVLHTLIDSLSGR